MGLADWPTQWTDPTLIPQTTVVKSQHINEIRSAIIELENNVIVGGTNGIFSLTKGTLAARPAFGNTGAVYIATDQQVIYYDTGTAWISVGGGQTTCYKNTVTLATSNSNVPIGIGSYNPSTDILLVFEDSTYIEVTQDYTLDGNQISIDKVSGTWNSGTTLNFIVIKNITGSPPVGYNGSQLAANSVLNAQLGTDLQVGSLATLTTTTKASAIAAINEVKANAAYKNEEVFDSLLTTTNATAVATYTPTQAGNFLIGTYLRIVTATTNITVSITYTDGSNAQQNNTMYNNQSVIVGNYSLLPVFINSVANQPITVTITAGTANQVYTSASITGV